MTTTTARVSTGPRARSGGAALLAILGVLVLAGQLYAVLAAPPEAWDFQQRPRSASELGTTTFAVAYAAAFILCGPLIARVGPRVVLLASLSGSLVATMAVALALSWVPFLLSRGVQGLVAAPFTPASLTLVHQAYTGRVREMVTTAVVAAGLSAAVIAQIVAQLLMPGLHIRYTMLLTAAAIGGLLLLALLQTRHYQQGPTTDVGTTIRSQYLVTARLLGNLDLLRLMWVAFILVNAMVIVYEAVAHMPFSTGQLLALRLMTPLAAGAAVASRLRMSARSATRLMAWSLLLAGAAAALLIIPLPIYIVGLCLFVLVAAVTTTAPALIGQLGVSAGPRALGNVNALYAFAIFAGASIGAWLATYTITKAGPWLAMAAAAVLYTSGALAATSSLNRAP